MTELTLNTDRSGDALKKIAMQFKSKEHFEEFLKAYLIQDQELENVFYDVFLLRMLGYAAGAQVDVLGRIVGETRQSRNDTDYLAAIRARIRLNRQNAKIEDILYALSLVLGGKYQLTRIGNLNGVVRLMDALDAATDPSPEAFDAALQKARVAGSRLDFQYSRQDEDHTLKWSSGDAFESAPNTGFGNDAGTTGGKWSDVVDYEG